MHTRTYAHTHTRIDTHIHTHAHTHTHTHVQQVRVVAYTQFLESYKSVALASMAAAFNVRDEFLDNEVAELIVAGRINARIDKVRIDKARSFFHGGRPSRQCTL